MKNLTFRPSRVRAACRISSFLRFQRASREGFHFTARRFFAIFAGMSSAVEWRRGSSGARRQPRREKKISSQGIFSGGGTR